MIMTKHDRFSSLAFDTGTDFWRCVHFADYYLGIWFKRHTSWFGRNSKINYIHHQNMAPTVSIKDVLEWFFMGIIMMNKIHWMYSECGEFNGDHMVSSALKRLWCRMHRKFGWIFFFCSHLAIFIENDQIFHQKVRFVIHTHNFPGISGLVFPQKTINFSQECLTSLKKHLTSSKNA